MMEGVKSTMEAIDEFVMKHIKPVLIQELDNKESIHLYSIGEYWRAFDKSAYALSLILPDSEWTLLTVRDYPFPVLMVSTHYEVVNRLLLTKVVAQKILITYILLRSRLTGRRIEDGVMRFLMI